MSVASYAAADRLSDVAGQMGKWLDRVLGQDYQRFRADGAWHPAVNLYEDADAYYLVADLAGVDHGSIDLRPEGRSLLLRGERPTPRPPQGEEPCGQARPGALRLHVMEIDHGPFVRRVQLPEAVDADRIEACTRSGLLWVKMPKKPAVP